MTAKAQDGFPFQWIPEMIYTDNGPIAKSQVFQNVMDCLGIKLATHLPNGKDGRRVTARSKGKVERPFRTVKEACALPCTTFTNLKPKQKLTCGCISICCITTTSRTELSHTRGWKIGCETYPRAACARCAVGSGSVLLPALRNEGKWVQMPEYQLKVWLMK